MKAIRGVVTALVTPLDRNEQVNVDVLGALVDFGINAGVDGFYVCGAGGEGPLLAEAERRRAAEAVVEASAGRAAVIVHVGAIDTRTASRLATHAATISADAVAAIPPFFYKQDLLGIEAYYRAIGQAGDLPLFLYNLPGLVGYAVTSDMFKVLMELPTVAGVKYSAADLYEMRNIIDLGGGRLSVMSGVDEMFVAALAMGASGAIGTTENFMAQLHVAIYRAFCRGDIQAAQELQARGNRLIKAVLAYPGVAATKALVTRLGFDCGLPCPPNRPLTPAELEGLNAAVDAAGFESINRGELS